MSAKVKDIISTSVILVLTVIMFTQSFSIEGIVQMDVNVGPDFFPKLVSICLIVLSLIKFYQIFTLRSKDPEYDKKTEKTEKTKLLDNKVLFVFLAIIVYATVFSGLGFFISSILFLFFLFWLLTDKPKRNYLLFAVISVATSGIIYVLFVYGFQLLLPAGLLG